MLETFTIVLGGILTATVGWLFGAKHRVSEPDCTARREEIKNDHSSFCVKHTEACPENRQVLTRKDHDRICDLKLHPMQKKLEETSAGVRELNKKVDRLLLSSRQIEGNGDQ